MQFTKSINYNISFGKQNCPSVNSSKLRFQRWPEGVSTHLFLLFFLLGAFLMGRTGQPAARLLLDFGAFVIFGGFGWSSSRRCFSFSTFFFFFLSFLSFFFLGLMMGPCESAVSCSCTAFSWKEKKRCIVRWEEMVQTGCRRQKTHTPAPATLPVCLPALPQSQSWDCSRCPRFHCSDRSLTMTTKMRMMRTKS